ncbi:myoferlin, partial [Biomphalaria glabrata]
TFEFELVGDGIKASDELLITIKDWERVGRNRQLGTAKLLLKEFTKGGAQELTLNLLDANSRALP